jgi:hypothetical protein
MARNNARPGNSLAVVPTWSTRAALSRAASVLRGAFSSRLVVDCEANGAPVCNCARSARASLAQSG